MFSRQHPSTITHNPNEPIKIRRVMTILAWICLIVGVVMSLATIKNYSDSNHLLMVGIGFLVASFHIYTIGLFMALMFKAKQENAPSDHLDEEPVS